MDVSLHLDRRIPASVVFAQLADVRIVTRRAGFHSRLFVCETIHGVLPYLPRPRVGHLAIRGVGRSEDELVPFDDLSRGTREQLLLALRAAIALEIAKDEPACLILDDVLVHTDAVRQQNVLDFLQTLSQRVQIVILTCHADRYRGVGQLLAVTR